MGIHAFEEQIRFIKGGYAAIIDFFWTKTTKIQSASSEA